MCVHVVLALFAPVASAKDFYLEFVSADQSQGFNFPYYLRLPKDVRPDNLVMIVESNNTGVSDNFNAHIEGTKVAITGYGIGPSIAQELDLPLLMPVFPRTRQKNLVYTHALDRDTLEIPDGPLKRLDNQLLAMVEHARARLADREINVHEKFLLCGFSASGTFSNRFAFLHPASLVGVVSGAVNGIPMLPVPSVAEEQLVYPIGVSDIELLTGKKFARSSWQELPQLIFMGALDENDATLFDDAFSELERTLVHEVVGREMLPDRWVESQSVYMRVEANVTFITYGDLAHGTDGRVHRDLVNFVRSILRDLGE